MNTKLSKESLGEIAYTGYCASRNWKSIRGEDLPRWKDVQKDVQFAWIAAGVAIVNHIPTLLLDENPQGKF